MSQPSQYSLKKRILISELKNCARCNQTHVGLNFKLLSRSPDNLYFATCPRTEEPILLRLNDINDAKQINQKNNK